MENLENIEVTGEISLQKVSYGMAGHVVLILGPTGAGKSSLVETLAGPSQKLSLSSNQLAGYTQHINPFRVVNVGLKAYSHPIYVVDTPGFSDSKFSEKEILDMVNAWLRRERLPYVRILYVVPINGTRLPGTQRRTLEMLKTFLQSAGQDDLKHLTFVTTMWDMLHSEGALSRGQSNFEELRKKQLKHLIDDSAKIVKFRNTPLSAIRVLDAGIVPHHVTDFTDLEFRTPELYRDLCERIENALLEKRNIEDSLAQPEAQTSVELRNLLERNFCDNDDILTKFIKQFTDYGSPAEGFEDAAQRLLQEIDLVTNCPRQTRSILPNLDSTDPDISTPVPPPSVHMGDQMLQTLPPMDAIDSLVIKLEPGQPQRTLTPIVTPERSPPTQSILPKASTELDVITPVQSPTIRVSGQTFPHVEATNTPVLAWEATQSEPTSTTVMTAEHHASLRTSLKEIPRRTKEAVTKPWKKLFGPKH